VATPLGAGDGTTDDTAWLQPNEETIERNRRLEAGPVTESDSFPGAAATGPEAAVNVATIGPVYSYDSPGADGSLSERDLAERRERASRAEEEGSQAADAATRSGPPADSAAAEDEAAQVERASTQEDAAGADAGTSVAGQPASEQRGERRYTPVDEVAWQWPVEGDVVGQFGEGGSITAGIDIAGQKGQPVKAAGPGIVVYAGSGVRGYGNLILLKHNNQFLSAYAHNETLNVKENDVVEAGEVIATMGDSDAEDVRLHFEVRKDGQPQNPLEFLPAR